jgi:hypothetical protein
LSAKGERDLRDVMAEERHRGRRQGVVDTAMRRILGEGFDELLALIRSGARDDVLIEAVTVFRGREPDAEERTKILRCCREYRRQRR